MKPLRPCLQCNTPTPNTTCPTCHYNHHGTTTPTPTHQETLRRAAAVQAWINRNGMNCPGNPHLATPPHTTNKLTAAHTHPRKHQGDQGTYTAQCPTCNAQQRDNLR